jgi:Cu(I)/Ag(I) efflux system membrane fusion protein
LFAGSDAVVYQVIDDLVQARKVKILASGEEYSLIDIEPGAVVVSEAAFAVDSEFQIQGKTSLIKKLEEHKFGFNTQYQSSEGLNALSKDQESRNLAEHLIGDYLNLWQFLSQDDLPQSRNAAEIFDNRLAHTQHPSAVWLIRQLSEEPDLETLPALRNRFHKISELFLKIGELGLLQGMNLKRAYCPMAFDSQGAEWIQKGEKVINPYFGNSMLHCGSIREDF